MPEAVQGLRTMGARGWNITMPGKNIMCKLADKVSPASEISGACNTIVNDNGVLTAYTTDGVGFMRAVAENGVDIIGKKMTLLGAGGAARRLPLPQRVPRQVRARQRLLRLGRVLVLALTHR